jgi:hypothetical protein
MVVRSMCYTVRTSKLTISDAHSATVTTMYISVIYVDKVDSDGSSRVGDNFLRLRIKLAGVSRFAWAKFIFMTRQGLTRVIADTSEAAKRHSSHHLVGPILVV